MVPSRRSEATSCHDVKVAEGYVGSKLHKRGIKARERLAVMRAKLWHREAHDFGTDPCLAERYAGAWCQAGLVDDDADGTTNTQMVSTRMGIKRPRRMG